MKVLPLRYSCIQGGHPGTGNTAQDPSFFGTQYFLAYGSPCIDAGTSDGATRADIDTRARYDHLATPNTGAGASPYYDMGAREYQNDTDGDGITDDEDNCPASDHKETIIINCCDSGVENQLFDDGCTMSDLIAECAKGVKNHGQFVSCVSHLTNAWKKQTTITGKEKGAIQSCAAQSYTCEGPIIKITDPTTDDFYDPPGTPSIISLGGTASDDDGIVEVTWSNNRGGSGTASGTTNWSISGITLFCGDHNIITVTAEDSEGNTGTDTLTVDGAPCPPTGLRIE